ncbi:uncharacterized protein LOC102806301 [Saccoglossus kowalevskii]
MLPATIPSVTFLPHTTQSRTTIPLPTVPRTSSFFSTLLGETTQSRTTIGLPTVPRITTTGPTAIPITQSPCNVLTVDENSRIEVLEPIPTMSAVTACIWAQTDEVSGGTPFSYNTAGADNEFFLSFPENFRVGIRGATTGATGISVNDGAWHHVCVTWNSVGGIFNIYDNGVLAFGGSSFRTGLMIRSGGVLILGQEQDTLGGGFDPGQAFKGDLANFNMWNRELDGVDILHSTNDCSCDIEGNVFSWKSDSLDIAGTALVSAEDFCPKPSLTNVALDKTATQSSDWSVSFPASNAVDGNTNTHWGSGSCTSTQRDVNAWWKVDLGENYLVYEVILTNRQDPCCKTRILNSEVRIGLSDVISENIRCGELVALEQTSQSDVVFECDSPIVGRYASLQLVDRTDLLNFCEMRVMALENIGRNGIASQISTGYRGLASYAIDGNDNSIYYRGSCTHTSAHLNPWWKVDLGETYDIFKVVITNRQDCCPHRIDGAVVLIGEFPDISQNSQCDDQVDLNANTYQRRIPFDCRLRGRYAGVQLKHHTNFLTLCEVEVYDTTSLNESYLNETTYSTHTMPATSSHMYNTPIGSVSIPTDTAHMTQTTKSVQPSTTEKTSMETNTGSILPLTLTLTTEGNSLTSASESFQPSTLTLTTESNSLTSVTESFQPSTLILTTEGNSLTTEPRPVQPSTLILTTEGNSLTTDTGPVHLSTLVLTSESNSLTTDTGSVQPSTLTLTTAGNSLTTDTGPVHPSTLTLTTAGSSLTTDTGPVQPSTLTLTTEGKLQPALVNVALNKTAILSSNWSIDFPASNAVDGNTNTYWGSGSCTSTLGDINAWWKVDLGENYLVYEVILTNRLDQCCNTRILNSEVRIGLSDEISENTRCGEIVTLEQTSQANIVFECDSPIVGRYASLQLVNTTNIMNFCEMQVMAIENLAGIGSASQSSTNGVGQASRGIDGNDDTVYAHQFCTHTLQELNAWWKVDLGATYDVFKVVITNRQDCCSERIDGAVVLIGEDADISQNHQCGVQIDWNSNTYENRIPFDCQLSGRYVGVQLKDHNNWLTLCEVEVYGS